MTIHVLRSGKQASQSEFNTSIERIHAIHRKCLSRGRKIGIIKTCWSKWLEEPSHNTWYTQHISLWTNLQINLIGWLRSFILSHLLVVAEVQAATPMILYNFVSPMNKDWYGSRRIKLEERDRSKYPVSVVQCSCAIKENPIFSSLLLHSDFPHNKNLSNSQCLPNQKHGNNSFSENL